MIKLVKSLLLSMVIALMFALPVLADTSGIQGPLVLIADNEDYTYLGKVTSNKYDADSIFNEYGLYGSKYAVYSTANEYGLYGGAYSVHSPFNKYTTTPPYIVDADGDIVGRLTLNEFIPNAISPYSIYDVLVSNGF